MTRPKVLFITRKWPPAVGGMEIYCRELVGELRKRVEVDLRALPGRSNGRPPSFATLLWFGVVTMAELLLRRTQADVVHVGDLAIWPLAWFAKLRTHRISQVLSAHGSDIALAHRRGFGAAIYRLYMRLAILLLPKAVILANSRATAGLCQASGFQSVRVVPLGTSLRLNAAAKPEPYILFVGRLTRQKGCAWFIENVLPLLDPALTLVVAGVVWHPDEERALRRPRVEYRGPVFGDELARLRACATAIVVPNLGMGADGFEGFGLSALEGAADGGVVLAANVYGLMDSVRDGETGFLLPAGDAQRWADKTREVAGWTESQRAEFLARARAVVSRLYCWSRVADETLDAYGQLVARARGMSPSHQGPQEWKRGF